MRIKCIARIWVYDQRRWWKLSGAGTPHGDHHDLWIDPEDGNRMIVGDDGGAQISFDAANNWSSYMNQPTAQFYQGFNR
ncbi:MAG: hypothetical protein IPP73_10180 [Chitinophagaceae bacterium]|nr:hypothetical protein [Chitinophagaceae bacterium]